MASSNCLVTDILQNVFFSAQQEKATWEWLWKFFNLNACEVFLSQQLLIMLRTCFVMLFSTNDDSSLLIFPLQFQCDCHLCTISAFKGITEMNYSFNTCLYGVRSLHPRQNQRLITRFIPAAARHHHPPLTPSGRTDVKTTHLCSSSAWTDRWRWSGWSEPRWRGPPLALAPRTAR